MTVFFDSRSYSCATKQVEVTKGSKFGALPVPTIPEGVIFKGWYNTGYIGSEPVTAETVITWDSDIILYARYVVPGQEERRSVIKPRRGDFADADLQDGEVGIAFDQNLPMVGVKSGAEVVQRLMGGLGNNVYTSPEQAQTDRTLTANQLFLVVHTDTTRSSTKTEDTYDIQVYRATEFKDGKWTSILLTTIQDPATAVSDIAKFLGAAKEYTDTKCQELYKSVEGTAEGTVVNWIRSTVWGAALPASGIKSYVDAQISGLSTPSSGSPVVHKTGDETINGTKTFVGQINTKRVERVVDGMDVTVTPSSTISQDVVFKDQNSVYVGACQAIHDTNGNIHYRELARRMRGTEVVDAAFDLYVDPSYGRHARLEVDQFDVEGNQKVGNALTVGGAATVEGNLNAQGDMSVTGNATITGDLKVSGGIDIPSVVTNSVGWIGSDLTAKSPINSEAFWEFLNWFSQYLDGHTQFDNRTEITEFTFNATGGNVQRDEAWRQYAGGGWQSQRRYVNWCLKKVGQYGFYGVDYLYHLVIPNCTEIGYRAFKHTYGGVTVVQADSLETLGSEAFWRESDNSLVTFYAPKLKIASTQAFRYCRNLRDLNFDSLTDIGYGCFMECYELPDKMEQWFPKLQYAGHKAFYNDNSIVTASFPSIKFFGDQAFYHCDNLKYFHLPVGRWMGIQLRVSSAQTVSFSMGWNDPTLGTEGDHTTIASRSTVGSTPYPTNATLNFIGASAVADCDALVGIAAPYVQVIANSAFNNSSTYKYDIKCDIQSVEHIGSEAFRYMGYDKSDKVTIRNLNIPKCVYIGSCAFGTGDNNHWGSSVKYVRADELLSVADHAFCMNYQLTSLYAPKLTTIGYRAFWGCIMLKDSRYISNPLECWKYTNGTKVIYGDGRPAPWCTPADLEGMEDTDYKDMPTENYYNRWSFDDNKANWAGLEDVVEFPEVTTIGQEAFNGRGSHMQMTKLVIPKCTKFGKNCFGDCPSLTEIYLMDDTGGVLKGLNGKDLIDKKTQNINEDAGIDYWGLDTTNNKVTVYVILTSETLGTVRGVIRYHNQRGGWYTEIL